MFGRATIRLGIGPHSSLIIHCTTLAINRLHCVSKKRPTLAPLQLAPMEDVEPQDPQSTDPTTSQLP